MTTLETFLQLCKVMLGLYALWLLREAVALLHELVRYKAIL